MLRGELCWRIWRDSSWLWMKLWMEGMYKIWQHETFNAKNLLLSFFLLSAGVLNNLLDILCLLQGDLREWPTASCAPCGSQSKPCSLPFLPEIFQSLVFLFCELCMYYFSCRVTTYLWQSRQSLRYAAYPHFGSLSPTKFKRFVRLLFFKSHYSIICFEGRL